MISTTPLEHLISCGHVDALSQGYTSAMWVLYWCIAHTYATEFLFIAGVRYRHGTYSLGWSNQFSVFSSNHFFLTNWRQRHHWKIPTTWPCTIHTPWRHGHHQPSGTGLLQIKRRNWDWKWGVLYMILLGCHTVDGSSPKAIPIAKWLVPSDWKS